jgi:hypothetical protein
MFLRNNTDLDLRRAKAVALHLAEPDGSCHRCGTQLSQQNEVNCEKCKSFNLNWWGS